MTTSQYTRRAGGPREDLVAGYLRELLDRPAAEFARSAAAQLAAVRTAQVPFPHLAHPRRFAECLAATARRSTLPRQPAYIGPRTTYSEPAQ